MKKIHVISALLAFSCLAVSNPAGNKLETSSAFGRVSNQNLPFKKGEKLSYNIKYGLVKAGEAVLRVNTLTTRNNRPVFHMIGTGKTTGMTDWFFPTNDRYETFLDTSSLHPVEFIRDVNEGGYTIKRHIIFDQEAHTARDLMKTDTVFQLEKSMQDIFSAFYYARSMDVTGIRPGDEIAMDVFLDHEAFPFKLKYLGTDNIELDDYTIRCLKFNPIVQEGRVFKAEESMTIWVSNDKNKIPVMLESELAVGSIKVKLSGYQNLAHPLNRY